MKKLITLILILVCSIRLNAQVKNDVEGNFPSEGSISESTWGTYMLDGNYINRALRIGVSNDGYTRAEIEIDNNNSAKGEIFFKTTTGSGGAITRMVLTATGNLGIGTFSPDKKLTVNGTTKTREVIVEENVGADFVFKDDYALPTLAEIESFIKANRHLPEIPPAEEMKREGVKVGALQMKLLQKIEELTLYVIELKKENKRQQKQIEQFEIQFRNL